LFADEEEAELRLRAPELLRPLPDETAEGEAGGLGEDAALPELLPRRGEAWLRGVDDRLVCIVTEDARYLLPLRRQTDIKKLGDGKKIVAEKSQFPLELE
jgi:hypothetical protein